MSILTVSNLNHSYGGREILENVNFRLLKGEHVGLIGPNGEGKSSFMNIITGKLIPDTGTIEWAKFVKVGYLDQLASYEKDVTVREVLQDAFSDLFEKEARINELYMNMEDASEDELNDMMEEVGILQDIIEHRDFYVIDSKIDELANNMGIVELGLDTPFKDLSGGQRSKVLLCKLLLEKPDILMLDEPTNYLDETQIEWLRRYLQEYENAFILISHDIEFLDSVINLIYHVENKELNRYVGNYSEFERLHELKLKQIENAYKKQQQEIKRLEDFVARNKANIATRNMAMSRQKMLDKMDRIELQREKPDPEFVFKEIGSTSRLIFETKDLVIGYDAEKPLTVPLNLRMERGDRIAITGMNGLGKTTLVKTLLGEIKPLSGEIHFGQNLHIGYFKQEETYGNQTAIDDVWDAFPSLLQNEVRAALAKCGLTTEQYESQVKVLSGGEKAKVRLCKVINKPTNIVMLDEPTNHLDNAAKDELKRALKEYNGGIFLISHEKAFYEDIATTVWNMEEFSLLFK
ncbi:ABC-F family ATP-binding cassette domain-containing protein [Helcococcus ovis]|uniref:ABC-F family ATP-binding cassette domain-containing protein n=1 Tax=Helcococcus ovis TaxID=72026 RepID=A0A4R9C370_9FIRM|nr:ABC-F family ATP-binding cassette domain-containing protein [Helcococcus ovis]TFF65230.1 ABC-F family ATP-binding cassette domain-containing protein [Helcococcus ovis]TFF65267.1 ABC-F family ATP-binding cassette domain-containing protein [Helcococcus ovis]TFF67087.1 ABC-F family ATP-binding cassette domain-containing protein [Helcococcus ovis]WNZ01787.1 ABC-F family ATP-binding cassette domain-containing protein [Helcococcus ovis]